MSPFPVGNTAEGAVNCHHTQLVPKEELNASVVPSCCLCKHFPGGHFFKDISLKLSLKNRGYSMEVITVKAPTRTWVLRCYSEEFGCEEEEGGKH